MSKWLSDFVNDYLLKYGLRILGAVVLLIVGFMIINRLKKNFWKFRLFKHTDTTIQSFFSSFISASLKIMLVLSAIIIVGVPSATVVAFLGSCGLALGLAMQGGLSNLAGGVLILLLKPFKLNDHIIAADTEGKVVAIGIFYTTLLSFDNKRIVIPNGSITSSTITNYSSESIRRLDLDFSVAAASDLDKVRSILSSIAEEDPRILKDPKTSIIISEFSAVSVKFLFRP